MHYKKERLLNKIKVGIEHGEIIWDGSAFFGKKVARAINETKFL